MIISQEHLLWINVNNKDYVWKAMYIYNCNNSCKTQIMASLLESDPNNIFKQSFFFFQWWQQSKITYRYRQREKAIEKDWVQAADLWHLATVSTRRHLGMSEEAGSVLWDTCHVDCLVTEYRKDFIAFQFLFFTFYTRERWLHSGFSQNQLLCPGIIYF